MRAHGLPGTVAVHPAGTATAEAAAMAVGCEAGQIVKTLVFVAEGRATVVLCAGDRQVDTALLAPLLGVSRKRLKMATRAEVLSATGYEVGGVAPIGMTGMHDIVADDSLRRFRSVWAAAGEPNAVFSADTTVLVKAVGAQWATVTRPVGGTE